MKDIGFMAVLVFFCHECHTISSRCHGLFPDISLMLVNNTCIRYVIYILTSMYDILL